MHKRRNNLILITNGFPFGNGETFLEQEIIYLSQRALKIFIISKTNQFKEIRPLPANVEVIKLKATSNILKILRVQVTILLHPVFYFKIYINEIKQLIKIKKFSFRPIVFKLIFHDLVKAVELVKVLKELMFRNDFSYNQATLYSYWLNSSATALSIIKKQKPDLFVVARGHGSDIYFELNKTGFHSFRWMNLKTLDRLYVVSSHAMKYNETLYNEVFPNVIVSKLGTEGPKVKISPYHKTEIYLIVSCSNIKPLKRIELIPEVLQYIQKFNIHWIHFGDGNQKESVKTVCEKYLGKNKNIQYEFKGNVSNKLIHDFYRENQVDLFLSTSETEGIPVSMMEAISYGIPIMATSVGGVPEIVNDNCGYLIPKEFNPQKAAKILDSFLDLNLDEKIRLRKNARLKWAKEFSSDDNYSKFVSSLFNDTLRI